MNTTAPYKKHRLIFRLNMLISAATAVLGISSIAVSALSKAEENFFYEFRYMTLNGTVFTVLTSLIILIAGVTQYVSGSGIAIERLYYLRLSSAVTESIIAVVIAMSFLPFVPDNPDILTFDSFNMHVIIPLLSIISFLLNITPKESVHPLLRLNCAWLITLYAAVVITLILTGLLPQDMIPYSFLDFRTQSVWYIIYFGCFIYSFTYVLSFVFTELNRRLSVLWNDENEKPVSSR